jgi:hypothetical protein
MNFKKQVQEWKDILLRGHDPKDLAEYTKQFHPREAAVRDGAIALTRTVQDKEAHKLLDQFIIADDMMSARYAHAYEVFVAGNGEFKAADALVRGRDRGLTDLPDKVVQRLGVWVQFTAATQQHAIRRSQIMALGIAGGFLLLMGTTVTVELPPSQPERVAGTGVSVPPTVREAYG